MSYPSWPELLDSYWVRGRRFPQIAAETPTFMGCPYATRPEDLQGADVAIIGCPYVTSWGDEWAGVPKSEWLAAPQRVRQQSIRYGSGYVQDFDIDVFDTLRVVDFGDAPIPPEANSSQSVDMIRRAQAAVEERVTMALEAGAIPVVIGQNSPCASYALVRCLAATRHGPIGVVSLDAHWDAEWIDRVTLDPDIGGPGNWLRKTIDHPKVPPSKVIEIGPRGMLEGREEIRDLLERGVHFHSGWEVRSRGVGHVCESLEHAYAGTEAVYAHFDMDVLGGAGPAPGDILGELAEPIGLSDYDVIRIAHEVGRRGIDAFSFICIPPGSAVQYRVIVYVIMYLLAGVALSRDASSTRATDTSASRGSQVDDPASSEALR
jgi:agmatinase